MMKRKFQETDLVDRGMKLKQADVEDLIHYCNFLILMIQYQEPRVLENKKNFMYLIRKQLKKMKVSWE